MYSQPQHLQPVARAAQHRRGIRPDGTGVDHQTDITSVAPFEIVGVFHVWLFVGGADRAAEQGFPQRIDQHAADGVIGHADADLVVAVLGGLGNASVGVQHQRVGTG